MNSKIPTQSELENTLAQIVATLLKKQDVSEIINCTGDQIYQMFEQVSWWSMYNPVSIIMDLEDYYNVPLPDIELPPLGRQSSFFRKMEGAESLKQWCEESAEIIHPEIIKHLENES